MICIIILLVLSTETLSLKEEITEIKNLSDSSDEYILCRFCGSDISSAEYLTSMPSPASRYAFNDTLFNKEQVLVQVLSNSLTFSFPVITATHSNCISVDEWEENETWFPGYRWKICVCPDCGDYKGWLFEPKSPKKTKKPFYGLVLSSLIGESCK